jgi:ribosomal protein L40E
MAMIDCRECEGKISERAKTCPHCGAPTMHPIRFKFIEISNALSLVCFSISYVILFFMHLN